MNKLRNNIFILIFVFGIITNLLVLFNTQYFYLRAIFSFVFLTLIPGFLIMLILKIRKISFWEYLVYTVGLSIFFVMFAGLLINWFLPVNKPLSLAPLLICFDLLVLALGYVAYKRNNKILFKVKLPKLDRLNKTAFILPLIFPILSILGAITLNNQGPNYLTMIMLGGIAAYVFLIVLCRNKLNKNIYPFASLTISISLLLMFSLRSWHVFASDTSVEYQMFQLTKKNFHWSMKNLHHGYNTCLSITILPTIFSWFLKINDEYIFKLIFPLISSFISLSVFLFLRRHTKHIFAFLGNFLFMAFPPFFFDIPIHTRQGISLLFFTLTLHILFKKTINPRLKKVLFLIFGFSMIVSHYSTTYIALALFIITYFLTLIFKKCEALKPKTKIYHLSGTLIYVLFIFTFLWYSQLAGISYGILDYTHKTVQNMRRIFTEEFFQEALSSPQWNIFYKPDLTSLLKNYVEEVTLENREKPYINLYPQEKYKGYEPQVVSSELLPLKTKPSIALKIYLFGEIIKKLVIVFIIVGFFSLVVIQIKKRGIHSEYTIMIFVSLLLLLAILILPFASVYYGTDRLYQQILVILSFAAVSGGMCVFRFVKKKNFDIILLSGVFILYFLFYYGFISQIFGGTEAGLQLNNFGTDYNKLYTHEAEAKSAEWLSLNYDKKSSINTDSRSCRLQAFDENFSFIFEYHKIVLPSIMDKNAYIYASYSNKIKEIGIVQILSTLISYNFPLSFLNQNKNKIYNNGGSEIFK